MAGGYFADAGLFLVDTVLGIYILIVLLRFLFQLAGADFYNPLSQFIVKASNPPLARLHKLIPSLWGIDLGAIVLLVNPRGTKARSYDTDAGPYPACEWRADTQYWRIAEVGGLCRRIQHLCSSTAELGKQRYTQPHGPLAGIFYRTSPGAGTTFVARNRRVGLIAHYCLYGAQTAGAAAIGCRTHVDLNSAWHCPTS